MDLLEAILTLLGVTVLMYYGGKFVLFSRMFFPKWCFPVSKTFFISMGEWAVVTGASEGIGRAYAFALAERGMNVVIMSRTKEKLDQVAMEIGEKTGRTVKVVVADFSKEHTFADIEEEIRDLNVGVLVNNIGILPNIIPSKFLESNELDKTITSVINCNVKTLCKMCKIILPGMENRRKGVIINIASGIASFPFPLYTLYAASKVFVERFSQGLQTEYKDSGILIQAVTPFGISTRMAHFQKTNIVTLLPEDFVQKSLQYIRAGEKTHGSLCHTILGWLLQSIPPQVLHSEYVLQKLQNYVEKKIEQEGKASTSK